MFHAFSLFASNIAGGRNWRSVVMKKRGEKREKELKKINPIARCNALVTDFGGSGSTSERSSTRTPVRNQVIVPVIPVVFSALAHIR